MHPRGALVFTIIHACLSVSDVLELELCNRNQHQLIIYLTTGMIRVNSYSMLLFVAVFRLERHRQLHVGVVPDEREARGRTDASL